MKKVKKYIPPEYFQAVKDRKKNFEIRKDEDAIQPGDILILTSRRPEGRNAYIIGDSVTRKVKYVLRNVPEYGLMEGYCIIGW